MVLGKNAKLFDITDSFIKIIKIPKTKPKSPILFKIIALIAALFACILVNQKLINK